MKMETVPVPADEAGKARLALGLAALFALGCLWLNPVGYVGGGADDEQYLAAARCWVEASGPCLPADHWWSRWPVIAPVATALALLGDSRAAVAVGASLSWGLLLFAMGSLGTRWFGWRAGVTALVAIAATPVVTAYALTPNPNVTELAFQLLALLAATIAYRTGAARAAFVGGLFAGLAFATRSTSILFLAASALTWLFLDPDRRRPLLWAIAGLAVVLLGEMAVYAAATGDPFYRQALALSHTGIPSAELPAGFDTSQSPLFNPAYIAAWRREMGIALFWPVDGWINVLLGPRLGTLLLAAALGAILLRRTLPGPSRTILKRAALGVALLVVLLTWGLAIDPKARMFLPAGALAALALGALVAARPDGRRSSLALGLVGFQLIIGLSVLAVYPNSHEGERKAARWIADHGGRIEILPGARSYLTFVAGAEALPDRGAGRPLLIALTGGPCEEAIGNAPGGGPTGRVVDSAAQGPTSRARLCLFEYAEASR
ncbi:ArnT family glycosyltransferase [Sphingomicrobium astaxanthinifaciens]|uniref:ArnT family glycosyltransferase n=1 Tax=Sphingomicrobium astaxanthinifaciens TaxID=1227949 RepID=UPI001FCADDDF|nr:glycosyltransferase family 39 protein [Sphingomicrobium astaxanthinifaciens]MCJ7420597.1 glycosyltransferase family 39 protein [Sphingomicrobium astaxanthinifaciens]